MNLDWFKSQQEREKSHHEWMDGWMGIRGVVRIAYSNRKCNNGTCDTKGWEPWSRLFGAPYGT